MRSGGPEESLPVSAPIARSPVPVGTSSGRFGTVLFRPATLFPLKVRRHSLFLFVAAFVSTAVSVWAGNFFFPASGGLVAVFLLVLSLEEEMVAVLEENRENPHKANLRLARKIICVFLGMCLGFALLTFLVEGTTKGLGPQLERFSQEYLRIQGVDFGTASANFRHNGIVLVGCFLCALLFRAGGALLVLGWNASVWGAVYGFMVRTQPDDKLAYGAKVFLTTFPHVAVEATGYVLAALAGIFLSKAMAKYHWDSSPFRRVALASAQLLVIGLGLVAVGANLEAWVTPRIANALFH